MKFKLNLTGEEIIKQISDILAEYYNSRCVKTPNNIRLYLNSKNKKILTDYLKNNSKMSDFNLTSIIILESEILIFTCDDLANDTFDLATI